MANTGPQRLTDLTLVTTITSSCLLYLVDPSNTTDPVDSDAQGSGLAITFANFKSSVGSVTYSADGVTLALTGTTFSIHNGGVGTTQLGTGAVTYANIQNVAAHSLLGNTSGSAAAPAEIAVTLTNHGALVGTGTGVTATATGATGVPLIGQGGSADPVFQATGVKIDSHFGAITADTDASTVTMDLSVSDWHSLLTTSGVGGNRTLAVSNATVGQQFGVIIQQAASGGPYTVTWFSGILWSGGTVPTLTTTASKRDVFGFKCISAGVYLGFIMGQNF